VRRIRGGCISGSSGVRASRMNGYPRLAIEETLFVNYGYVPQRPGPRLHPRGGLADGTPGCRCAPRMCGLCSPAWSHLRQGPAGTFRLCRIRRWRADLECRQSSDVGLHYCGLRLGRREGGTRVYQTIEHPPRDVSGSESRPGGYWTWWWPAVVLAARRGPVAASARVDERRRLLAPFDPVFWDRRRIQ
jgi:hypothetical protein